MKITFLGTGTSQGIPVIGCDCPVCISTDPKDKRLRVSIQIEIGYSTLVVDVGPDFRQQMLRAGTRRVDAILLTHSHSDHIAGLDDIRPFNFKYRMDMPVYGQPNVLQFLEQRHPYIFEANYPGVPKVLLHQVSKHRQFYAANTPVTPIEIFHGKLPILGYRIQDFAYLTDFKHIEPEEIAKLKDLDTLVVSALQHQEHHSHSSLSESIAFAKEVGARQTYFSHISHHMGTHAETEALLPDGINIAYDGLILEL